MFKPTLLLMALVSMSVLTVRAQSWSVASNGDLLLNNNVVQLKGFAVTCTEYLLRGIGTKCIASYNWNDGSNIITSLNTDELNAMYSHLLPAPAGVVPSLRLCLTAAYWLDVETSAWKSNRNSYPNLSAQYRTLIDKFVADATSRGVVVILDLHWNNDVQEQQPMSQKGASVGDSLTFWTQVAQRYKSNPLVFYELYNEPHASSFSQFFDGDSTYEGMKPLANAVFNQGVQGMILVAGAYDYAYDAQTLVQFASQMPTNVMNKIGFVVHPYMGPYQAGDAKKNADGFVALLDQLAPAKRPVFATELGQYCCSATGACYAYNGVFNGQPMGYVQAVLTELTSRKFHWNAWGWRPHDGAGNCNSPDANEGPDLYDSAKHGGQGADYDSLFPLFYGPAPPPTTKAPTTLAPTSTKQPTSTSAPTTKKPTSTSAPSTGTTSRPTVPTAVTKAPSTKKPTTAKPTKKPTPFPTQKATKSPTSKATPPTTKAPTVQSTSAPSQSSTCGASWGQCGGLTFGSRACCSASDKCIVSNEYYSQCIPQPTPAPVTSGLCSGTWAQCGGIGFAGSSTCCSSGDSCVVNNEYYSQCRPASGRRQLRRQQA